MDANGVVFGVTGRQTSNGRTVYDIQLQAELPEGVQMLKVQTWNQAEAQRAQQFTNPAGQRCSFRYSVTQKGQYTNYDLQAIAPEGQLPPESTIPIASGSQGGGFKGGGGMTPERETKIVKQSSLATAGALVGNLFAGLGPEFLAQAEAEQDRLAKKYFAQVMGSAAPAGAVVPATVPPVETPIIPNATTPAEIAAQVPGVAVGAAAADIAWT